jgi:hypothetical protein
MYLVEDTGIVSQAVDYKVYDIFSGMLRPTLSSIISSGRTLVRRINWKCEQM